MNLNGQEVEIITRGNQTSLSVPMAIPDLTEERLQIADALLIVALIVVAALFPPKAAIDLEVPIELPVLLDERLITEMAVIEPLDLLMIGIATLVTPSDLVLVLHCVPIETDLVLPYAPIGTVLALHSAPIGIIHQNTQLIAALLVRIIHRTTGTTTGPRHPTDRTMTHPGVTIRIREDPGIL